MHLGAYCMLAAQDSYAYTLLVWLHVPVYIRTTRMVPWGLRAQDPSVYHMLGWWHM